MERGIVRQTHGTIDVRSPKLVAHLFVAIHDLQTTDVLHPPMAELPLALQGSRYDRRLRGEHGLHLGCQIGDPAVTSVFVGAFNQPTRTTTTKVRIACEHPVADPAPPQDLSDNPLSRSNGRCLALRTGLFTRKT